MVADARAESEVNGRRRGVLDARGRCVHDRGNRALRPTRASTCFRRALALEASSRTPVCLSTHVISKSYCHADNDKGRAFEFRMKGGMRIEDTSADSPDSTVNGRRTSCRIRPG